MALSPSPPLGQENGDKEFCVFHTETEVSADNQQEELLKALDDAGDGPGANRPEHRGQFIGATFRAIDLSGETIAATDAHDIRFDYAQFQAGDEGLDFTDTTFVTQGQHQVSFAGAEFITTGDGDVGFPGATFRANGDGDVAFSDAMFRANGDGDVAFSGATFRANGEGSVWFRDATFTNVDLQYGDFAGAYFQGVAFTGANLRGANLTNVNFQGTDLSGTNLVGTNFLRGNLEGVDFSKADLRDAKLSEANLWNADFRDANLNGATFPEKSAFGLSLTEKGANRARTGAFFFALISILNLSVSMRIGLLELVGISLIFGGFAVLFAITATAISFSITGNSAGSEGSR